MSRVPAGDTLTQQESPHLLPQLFARCGEVSRLKVTPSAAQWDTLLLMPPRTAERPSKSFVDEATPASCLQHLQLESPVWTGTGAEFAQTALCPPAFANLRELHLRSVEVAPSPSASQLCDLPLLRHLQSLTLCAFWGPAAMVSVERVRMWSQIAPELRALLLQGTKQLSRTSDS